MNSSVAPPSIATRPGPVLHCGLLSLKTTPVLLPLATASHLSERATATRLGTNLPRNARAVPFPPCSPTISPPLRHTQSRPLTELLFLPHGLPYPSAHSRLRHSSLCQFRPLLFYFPRFPWMLIRTNPHKLLRSHQVTTAVTLPRQRLMFNAPQLTS